MPTFAPNYIIVEKVYYINVVTTHPHLPQMNTDSEKWPVFNVSLGKQKNKQQRDSNQKESLPFDEMSGMFTLKRKQKEKERRERELQNGGSIPCASTMDSPRTSQSRDSALANRASQMSTQSTSYYFD